MAGVGERQVTGGNCEESSVSLCHHIAMGVLVRPISTNGRYENHDNVTFHLKLSTHNGTVVTKSDIVQSPHLTNSYGSYS